MQVVESHDELQSGGEEVFDLDALCLLERFVLLKTGLLDHVDFACFQSVELGLWIANDHPLDAVKIHRMTTSHTTGGFAA